MPKVSVIIPTYNRAQYINCSIESVLRQKYKDFELIIVDDGSTDNTQKVLSEYGDKIHVIRQGNSGVAHARNTGIRAARGEWVSFLDSDDEWMPEYLEWQMRRVCQHPEIITHLTNSVTIQLDGTRENLFQETCLANKIAKDKCLLLEHPLRIIINYSPWFCDAMVMKRDLLFKIGLFDPNLRVGEDLDIVARMALRGPFSICNRVLVKAIRRTETIDNLVLQARKRGLYTYEAFGKVYANLLRNSELNWIEKMAVKRAMSHNRRALGNVLVIANRRHEARKYYIKSFFLYPSVRSVIKSIATILPGKISVSLIKNSENIMPGDNIDKV